MYVLVDIRLSENLVQFKGFIMLCSWWSSWPSLCIDCKSRNHSLHIWSPVLLPFIAALWMNPASAFMVFNGWIIVFHLQFTVDSFSRNGTLSTEVLLDLIPTTFKWKLFSFLSSKTTWFITIRFLNTIIYKKIMLLSSFSATLHNWKKNKFHLYFYTFTDKWNIRRVGRLVYTEETSHALLCCNVCFGFRVCCFPEH